MQPVPPSTQAPVPPSAQPPVQQPPAYPPQPRPGAGRFWLGVLTGGCGVLVLQALFGLVAVLLVGSAISSALRQGGGGLPAGLPFTPNLPNVATRSDPCSPQPCLAHGGLTVLVGTVQRSGGAAETGGQHVVQVDVTFVDTAGAHTITPEEIAIRDSTGAMTLPGLDRAAVTRCGATSASQDLQPGQRAGPFSLCYAVGGSTGGPLTLVWSNPEDLSLTELKLP